MRILRLLVPSLLLAVAITLPAQAFAQFGLGCRRAPIYSAFKCYHFTGGCGPEMGPDVGTIWFRVRCEDLNLAPVPDVVTYSAPWALVFPTIWSDTDRLDAFLAAVPPNLGNSCDIARNGCSPDTGFVLYWSLDDWSQGRRYCLEYFVDPVVGGPPPAAGDPGWVANWVFAAAPAGATGAGGPCNGALPRAEPVAGRSSGFMEVGGFYLPEPVPEYYSSPAPGRPDIYTTGGDGPDLSNCSIVYGNGDEGRFSVGASGLLPDWGGWTGYDASADYVAGPVAPAGDFSKLFVGLPEFRSGNGTAQATFVDDGSHTNNPPTGSTGGQLSNEWLYGPSGYVVNYSGGLAPPKRLRNEIWSPAIAWPHGGGGVDTWLEYEVMSHLPLANGMFEMWAIRSSSDGGSSWGPWLSHGQASYSEEPRYETRRIDVSTLVEAGATHVQISLGVHQLEELFGLPGGDATPGPWFDNVRLLACSSGNWPVAAARPADLWRDGWPASGLGPADSMLPADMRIDLHAGRDLEWESSAIAYDSQVRVRARATAPGTSITSATMHWRLRVSPAFGPSVRPGLAGVTDLGGGLYEGASSPASVEQVAPGLFEYAYDPPPEPGGFYPGDWFFYAFEFHDSGGGSCWLPASGISGAGVGGAPGSHPGGFTARGMPSIHDGAGNHAKILVWDNSGEPDELATARRAMGELGYVENVDFDVYQSRQPTARRSGDARVQLNQIGGYDCILFLAGNSPAGAPMGNGGGPQFDDDDAADLLFAWHQLPGPRTAFHFGDHIAEGLAETVGGQNYLVGILSAYTLDRDVAPYIGNNYTPLVDGDAPIFSPRFAVTGQDPHYPTRDAITPDNPATAPWRYLQSGAPGPEPAGIWHVWSDGVDPRYDALMPFALRRVSTPVDAPTNSPLTAAALLLESMFQAANRAGGSGPTVGDTPPNPTQLATEAYPNPFNPQLTLKVWAPGDGPLRVRLLDLRGRELAVLHDGPSAGPRWVELGWDARDAGGRPLPSGVYLYESTGFGQRLSGKVVLVR